MLSVIQEDREQRWKDGDRERYLEVLAKLTARFCNIAGSTAASPMLTQRRMERRRVSEKQGKGGCTLDTAVGVELPATALVMSYR